VLTREFLRRTAMRLLGEERYNDLMAGQEKDLAYTLEGMGRFRVNLFLAQGEVRGVMRHIPGRIPLFEELHLPKVLERLAMERRGLVIVTGITGSGKSTTLAAMIDYMNRGRNDHIVTIEDPIEFVHADRKCVISQREVGHDSTTFAQALRAALRQDPDIILVGEIRNLETISTALMAADTGHVVMSTLHTTDVVQSIQRVISFYPPHQHDEVRMGLAANLRAVISQRLIPRRDGAGRIPAVEVMITTPTVREYILDPEKIPLLHQLIAEGVTQYGMQTFDQSVLALLREGLITEEEALRNCNNPNELSLKLKGIAATSDRTWQPIEAAEASGGAGATGASSRPGGSPAGADWMSRE
jgi:twitching motility protein PilT